MNSKDWKKIHVISRAKELAWEDLDKDDQKTYLAEAEKEWNKKAKEQASSLQNEINRSIEAMSDASYVSRADSSVYLPKKKKK